MREREREIREEHKEGWGGILVEEPPYLRKLEEFWGEKWVGLYTTSSCLQISKISYRAKPPYHISRHSRQYPSEQNLPI